MKSPLFCRLEESVKNATKSIVLEKYGTPYALSRYVNDALSAANREYFSRPHARKKKIEFQGYYKAESLIEAIVSNSEYKDEIIERDLKKQIEKHRGSDPRTIRSWIKRLENFELIKKENFPGGNFVYKINLKPTDKEYVPKPLESNKEGDHDV